MGSKLSLVVNVYVSGIVYLVVSTIIIFAS